MKTVQHAICEITEWITVPYASFQDVSVPIITKNTMENGRIHLFFELRSGSYCTLPLRMYATQQFTASIDAQIRLKTVRIIWTNHETYGRHTPPSIRFAVICIPNKIHQQFPSINYRDYFEVCRVFNIELL